MLDVKIANMLQDRRRQHLLRSHSPIEAADSTYVTIGGKRFLSFSSNNYLGLARHPKVIAACQSALSQYGVGSGSAYLIAGYSSLHQELEQRLAEFLHYPRVLLLSSGYLANTGVLGALFTKDDHIFCDKLNHASIIDGCLMSRAAFKRYPHCAIDSVDKLLQNCSARNKVIVSESIFGMDGTLAPLKQLSVIAAKHQAHLLIDDAHGIGVLGKQGQGAVSHFQLDTPILIGTMGKAFGTYGAFVAGESLLIESLIQTMRTYIYTTAIPPAIAAASLVSLSLLEQENWRREKLFELIAYFKQRTNALSLPCFASDTPIQGIVIGCNEKTLQISQALYDQGIYIKAIRPPTVPHSKARLRITLTAEHTHGQIDLLLETLTNALKKT